MHLKTGPLQTLDPVSQGAAEPPVAVNLPKSAARAGLTWFRLALASRPRVRQDEIPAIRGRWGRLTLAAADLPAPIIALRRIDAVGVQCAVGVGPFIAQRDGCTCLVTLALDVLSGLQGPVRPGDRGQGMARRLPMKSELNCPSRKAAAPRKLGAQREARGYSGALPVPEEVQSGQHQQAH